MTTSPETAATDRHDVDVAEDVLEEPMLGEVTASPQDLTRADRLARRILRIEDEAPGALFPMRGSLVLSAVRCLLTYVAIPLLVPIAGWLTPIATPVSLVLGLAAIAMAVTSLRRVWAAHWSGRWGYTAFAVVVLAALFGLVAYDLGVLLA